MHTDHRIGRGFQTVSDPRLAARIAAVEAQRASKADQTLPDADRAADASQATFDGDPTASDSDEPRDERQQLASDRDQAASDRRHADAVDLTAADEKAYETAATNERRCRSSATGV